MPKPNYKILICGILPPPLFGHSMMYKMLMESDFVRAYDVVFLDMRFWTYEQHKKITVLKITKMAQYYFAYIGLLIKHRPRYVLYNMSFYRMPFLKDFLFCRTGRWLGARIVLHDMGQYLPELYGQSNGLIKALVRHMIKITAAIIVMGESVKKAYAPLVPMANMYAVPGSVESTAHLNVPARLAAYKDRIVVLYFSFLSESKGVWVALNAIPQVRAANPNVYFQFGGPVETPQLHEKIKAFLNEHSLNDYVEYVGYVGDVNERTRLFRNADIFMFPTLRDVFGLVLLHAMAEGVPIVASREGTIPEILIDGENGILFPKGDAQALAMHILTLAGDKGLRTRMGEANRRRYGQLYAPDKYGQAMTAAFKHIAAMS